MEKIKVLVVGLGNMGLSHARAYKSIKGFEIVGLRAKAHSGWRRGRPPNMCSLLFTNSRWRTK
jgi:predicted dehydrogenase